MEGFQEIARPQKKAAVVVIKDCAESVSSRVGWCPTHNRQCGIPGQFPRGYLLGPRLELRSKEMARKNELYSKPQVRKADAVFNQLWGKANQALQPTGFAGC